MYEAFEEATSFEAYLDLMAENNNLKYTELGEIIPPDLIKDATVVDGVQLSLDFNGEDIADDDTISVEVL